jgi:hypothetical protein
VQRAKEETEEADRLAVERVLMQLSIFGNMYWIFFFQRPPWSVSNLVLYLVNLTCNFKREL